jgi:hypothetical protein
VDGAGAPASRVGWTARGGGAHRFGNALPEGRCGDRRARSAQSGASSCR